MKAVILAGGLGSRLSEETYLRPKPMVEVGGRPILWHIMKIYGQYGINEFVICLGYKGYVIKEYFANYFLHMSDVTISLDSGNIEVHRNNSESWKITLIDTGDNSMTGGRLRRIVPHLKNEDFCMTYGDGVADIDISALIDHHKRSGRLATVTAVKPPGRFGSLEISGTKVEGFSEKLPGDSNWINGGFFVLSPKVIGYIEGDETIWEKQPMERLAADGQLESYKHNGFWSPMDTLRDKNMLEECWASGKAPWKTWL
jgi:glucose-1-phosphate cytidylyltransferase